MGWHFRKSASVGPFRMNFSNAGVSYSFGVKGARISTNQRGTYVSFGSNGIYYRKRIGGSTGQPVQNEYIPEQFPSSAQHTITSGPVEQITDTDSQDFVNELNTKAQMTSYVMWLGIPAFILFTFFCFVYFNQTARTESIKRYFVLLTPDVTDVNIRSTPDEKGKIIGKAYALNNFDFIDTVESWTKVVYGDSVGYITRQYSRLDSTVTSTHNFTRIQDDPTTSMSLIGSGILILAVGCIGLNGLDRKRLSMEINYEMDDKIKGVYQQFLNYFVEGTHSHKIWQIIHSQGTYDWKRNGGAGSLINRIDVLGLSADTKPSRFFKTNIQIPHIKLKGTDLFFFPERLVIKKSGQFAAVFYKSLDVQTHLSRFIEDSHPSADAQIVDYTWKFINKNGGPDRRFNNNRQLPICLYSYYTFISGTGVYETICTSKQHAFSNFSNFIKAIGNLQNRMHLN